MTIQHHPADDTLLRHAAGSLNAGLDLVVAVHLRDCAQCRARVAVFEAAGGVLMEDLPPELLDPAAFTDVLTRLEDPPETVTARAPRRADLRLPPGMTLPAALAGCDIGRWLWFGPGVRYSSVRLPWAPAANVMLLRVAANQGVLPHGHAVHELTQILHGGYSDCTGRYGPGDLAEGDDLLLHQPRADAEGCICLGALEGGLRLGGWLGRLQRRLGG